MQFETTHGVLTQPYVIIINVFIATQIDFRFTLFIFPIYDNNKYMFLKSILTAFKKKKKIFTWIWLIIIM